MAKAEKIYLPSKGYKKKFPFHVVRNLANLDIPAPAETPRGPLLDTFTRELGGFILSNTNFVTRQPEGQHPKDWIRPTEEALKVGDKTRTHFAEPAVFDKDYHYPGNIIRVNRKTDFVIKVRTKDGETRDRRIAKPETFVFPTQGVYAAIRGLKNSFEDGNLKEWIEPEAVRAFGSRSGISFGFNIPVFPDLTPDPERPITASFSQPGWGIKFTEKHVKDARGNPAAVFVAMRAAARAVMAGSLRIYQPELELSRALNERRLAERLEHHRNQTPDLLAV